MHGVHIVGEGGSLGYAWSPNGGGGGGGDKIITYKPGYDCEVSIRSNVSIIL